MVTRKTNTNANLPKKSPPVSTRKYPCILKLRLKSACDWECDREHAHECVWRLVPCPQVVSTGLCFSPLVAHDIRSSPSSSVSYVEVNVPLHQLFCTWGKRRFGMKKIRISTIGTLGNICQPILEGIFCGNRFVNGLAGDAVNRSIFVNGDSTAVFAQVRSRPFKDL